MERIQIKHKLVLVGDPEVGKTSLVRKFVLDRFSDKYIITIGFKVSSKKIIFADLNGQEIELTLMIWDIMGQRSYELTPQRAFCGAKGALIISDLTRKDTMKNLPGLVTKLFKITDNLPLVFIANKNDLEDQIQYGKTEMAKVAKKYKAPYYITSAKTGENVDIAFRIIGKLVLEEQGILT